MRGGGPAGPGSDGRGGDGRGGDDGEARPSYARSAGYAALTTLVVLAVDEQRLRGDAVPALLAVVLAALLAFLWWHGVFTVAALWRRRRGARGS
ncbi:hypothetical protein [Pseudokineococcus sp. 1T1Z-3]|uniref:hypothetical protein n=1 Tax=Pseudokineococcus sp. 1T1Z-3 TaxID=3132745 RepID=UPI00309972D3